MAIDITLDDALAEYAEESLGAAQAGRLARYVEALDSFSDLLGFVLNACTTEEGSFGSTGWGLRTRSAYWVELYREAANAAVGRLDSDPSYLRSYLSQFGGLGMHLADSAPVEIRCELLGVPRYAAIALRRWWKRQTTSQGLEFSQALPGFLGGPAGQQYEDVLRELVGSISGSNHHSFTRFRRVKPNTKEELLALHSLAVTMEAVWKDLAYYTASAVNDGDILTVGLMVDAILRGLDDVELALSRPHNYWRDELLLVTPDSLDPNLGKVGDLKSLGQDFRDFGFVAIGNAWQDFILVLCAALVTRVLGGRPATDLSRTAVQRLLRGEYFDDHSRKSHPWGFELKDPDDIAASLVRIWLAGDRWEKKDPHISWLSNAVYAVDSLREVNAIPGEPFTPRSRSDLDQFLPDFAMLLTAVALGTRSLERAHISLERARQFEVLSLSAEQRVEVRKLFQQLRKNIELIFETPELLEKAQSVAGIDADVDTEGLQRAFDVRFREYELLIDK